MLESFIAQFYDDKPVPRCILLSHALPNQALLEEALSSKAERKCDIHVPQRGAKTGIVEHATRNAREALARRLAESSSQRTLLAGLKERFGLARTPRRVEVFDNSHIQGASAVGAMIVAGPEGFVKNQYRKFNIRSVDLAPGDDYAMMREVLTRRFKRLLLDEAEAPVGGVRSGGSDPIAASPDGWVGAPKGPTRRTTPARASRQPAPPPIDRRGGSALAFGVLRADAAAGPALSETEVAAIDADAETDPQEPDDTANDEFPSRPDLVLIDGGPGQLGVAVEVLRELGIEDIPLVGVAKGPDRDAGREHFHRPQRAPMMLEPRDPVLYFVQRLRDEAHRFAIGTHRAKRGKAIGANPLDEIAGIGPTRKRALLKHFGSAKAVSRASPDDLAAVEGISAQMARTIYDFFHERQD